MTVPVEQLVREFHDKFGFAVGTSLDEGCSFDGSRAVHTAGGYLQVIEKLLLPIVDEDLRVARLHLIVEELRELCEGLLDRDRTAVADALGDLSVVVHGSFVTWGLPHDGVVREIMRSNMTKEVGGHKPHKGVDYEEPQLKEFV